MDSPDLEAPPSDFALRLAQLCDLARQAQLSDEEFALAKARLLSERPTG